MTSFLAREEAISAQGRDLLAGLKEAEHNAETSNSNEAAAALRDAAAQVEVSWQQLEVARNDLKASGALATAGIAEVRRMLALVKRLRDEHPRDPVAIRQSLHADTSAESATLLDDLSAIDSWWVQKA